MFCAIMAIYNPANAFNVSGIISSDTVWANTSEPYIIVSPIQIAPGVTLTIEQGVSITGGSIAVLGILDVNGNAGNRVVFDNVSVEPGGNEISIDNPFHIDISYAEFNAGSLYQATGDAIYGSLTLTDSILKNIPAMYLWYPVADIYIERNIFLESGGISIGTDEDITVNIRNNIFNGQTTDYAVKNWASYASSQTIVEFNSFLDADKTALRLPSGYSDTAMIGENNWWGTTDTSVIESMIYDRNDDLTVANFINYSPFLTALHPNTPVLCLLQTEVIPDGGGTVGGGDIYPSGVLATLTATPATGYIFTGWSGDCSGTTSPLDVLMDTDKTCTATFNLGRKFPWTMFLSAITHKVQ